MLLRTLLHVLLTCVYVFKGSLLKAQYYFYNDKYYETNVVLETGVSAGIINSLTDLGGRKGIGKDFIKDLSWKVTKPSFGLYIVATFKDAVGLRLEGTFGQVASYDSILKKTDPDLTQRYGRNLSFRSKITDFQLAFEIHPLFFKRYDEGEVPYWSPYVIAGIGYFSFNPQANLNGNWFDLNPLHLEGQGFAEYPDRKPYKLNQINIPLGIGIKYEASALLNLRLEIVHRFLFTDYLDDVSKTYIDPALFFNYLQPPRASLAQQLHSRMQELQPGYKVYSGMQRGDPQDNDAFFTIQFKAGLSLRSIIKK